MLQLLEFQFSSYFLSQAFVQDAQALTFFLFISVSLSQAFVNDGPVLEFSFISFHFAFS